MELISNGVTKQLNENEIKKWNQILISSYLNTTNAYYVPATTAQGAYFITGATTVLDATIKLDKAIQTAINSSGFNADGTYSKPNSGVMVLLPVVVQQFTKVH